METPITFSSGLLERNGCDATFQGQQVLPARDMADLELRYIRLRKFFQLPEELRYIRLRKFLQLPANVRSKKFNHLICKKGF